MQVTLTAVFSQTEVGPCHAAPAQRAGAGGDKERNIGICFQPSAVTHVGSICGRPERLKDNNKKPTPEQPTQIHSHLIVALVYLFTQTKKP